MNILKVITQKREIGNIGERAAARYLRRHGYRILEKSYVAFEREIDIIAKKGHTLAFVEVKTRTVGKESTNESRPAAAVKAEKQRKIISAAKCFVGFNGRRERMRFDIIEVYLNEKKRVLEIKHLEAAFNYNTAHGGM